MSTLLDLINKYQESLSDAERKVFNSLTEEEKFSRLPPEFKEILLNAAMETVSNLNELKNAPAIFPDMALPQQLSSNFIFSLNTQPLILLASITKEGEEAFKNLLIHFCSYIGNFIELNAANPYITLRNINIHQNQLEAYTKLLFLSCLYFKEAKDELIDKFKFLKDNISFDFYFIEDSNNKEGFNKEEFNKKYKYQNCSLWIDDWLKIVKLESNKISNNKGTKKEQIDNISPFSKCMDSISEFFSNIFKALSEHPIASVVAIIVILFLLYERAERVKEYEIQQLKEQHREETNRLRSIY